MMRRSASCSLAVLIDEVASVKTGRSTGGTPCDEAMRVLRV